MGALLVFLAFSQDFVGNVGTNQAHSYMSLPSLTGAQKTRLRGLGQQLNDSLLVGQAGVTPTVLVELNRLLAAHELVKVRFVGADRVVRATLAATLAEQAPCIHAGSVGATALFFRQNPEPAKQKIML